MWFHDADRPVCRHWTIWYSQNDCPMSKISQFSDVLSMQYKGLCVFNSSVSLVVIVSICVLCLIIIMKSEFWIISLCLRLVHDTTACVVCLAIFLLKSPLVRSSNTLLFPEMILCNHNQNQNLSLQLSWQNNPIPVSKLEGLNASDCQY